MPFVDTFLQKLSGDVTRYVGASGQYYFSIDVVLDFSIATVFFNEIAVSNKMFLSAKSAFEFARDDARRRGSEMTTINNSNDGLREFREYCAELFCLDDAVETQWDRKRSSGQVRRRSRASTVENKTCGGIDISDRIRIIGKVVEELL